MSVDLSTFSIIGLIGTIIGILGFIYGIWKDRALKKLKKRANAPHFQAICITIDSNGKTIPQGQQGFYTYREKPNDLGSELFLMEEYEEEVPKDYPNHRPVGLILKNIGVPLRYQKVFCDEPYFFRQVQFSDNLYEFQYILGDSERGKIIEFNIKYETQEGFQGKQKWILIKGKKEIYRKLPKSRALK